MVSNLFFTTRYQLEIPFEGDLKKCCESQYPEIICLKDDPYWGIDDNVRNLIRSKYLSFTDGNKIFIYYSRAFLEGDYTGKPIFPYFKGELERTEHKIQIKGKLRFNKLFNIISPFVFVLAILLVVLLKVSWLFLLILPLFILMIKGSANNLEKEMISDFRLKFNQVQKL
jgi:hypothetical protein